MKRTDTLKLIGLSKVPKFCLLIHSNGQMGDVPMPPCLFKQLSEKLSIEDISKISTAFKKYCRLATECDFKIMTSGNQLS